MEVMNWIDLAENRDRRRALVNVVITFRVPKIAGSFLTRCEQFSFSRRTVPHGTNK